MQKLQVVNRVVVVLLQEQRMLLGEMCVALDVVLQMTPMRLTGNERLQHAALVAFEFFLVAF